VIGAIILAAGESRRMGGRPKPLLELGGETFLSLLVRTYRAAGVEEIRAVIHPALRARGAELAVRSSREGREEPSSSGLPELEVEMDFPGPPQRREGLDSPRPRERERGGPPEDEGDEPTECRREGPAERRRERDALGPPERRPAGDSPELQERGGESGSPGLPESRIASPLPRLLMVFPPQPTPEPLASLLLGMGGKGGPPEVEGRWEAMLVQPVDHPLVRADTVRRLIAAFREGGLLETAAADRSSESPPCRCPLILPVYRRRGGHPLLVAAELFGEVRRLDPGKEGLRNLLHADPARVLRLEVEDGGTVRGVNTPEDYAGIRQTEIRSGPPIRPRPE
jgi:CTP:molybdopterin cytidylyltransferase MocA